MVDAAVRASGFDEVGLLSLSSADHSEIAEITKGLADRYEGTNTSLSLPSTRVDAFNIDLAKEISRNGRRSGLTFAPEGGSERIRRVINKMVSEEDLIRTVSEAFAQGWRQVKLYFMCGLPTEEDADVLQIAGMAHRVIRAGRAAAGHNDVRCTISIGGFVPKPHTPFQWAAQAHPDVVDERLRKLRAEVNTERKLARNIGMRYHDGKPSLIEGLLARGDRRVAGVIERVWRAGGRFDGWSEHFDYDRWTAAAAAELEPLGRLPGLVHHPGARPRRGPALGPPRLRAGAGLALGRLAGRAGRPRAGRLPLDPVLRLRGLPGHRHRDRGRPERDHAAAADRGQRAGRRESRRQPAPPRPGEAANPAPPTVQRIRLRFAKRGRLRFLSHRDVARSFERAVRRAGVPVAHSHGFSPHPRLSWVGAAPDRHGQRGRVPGDRADPAGRPGRAGRRAGRRAARRDRRARRRRWPRAPRWPTGSTPAAG